MPLSDQDLKKDTGKPRWDLLPLNCIEGIVKVLTFGAQKYEDDGWKRLMASKDGENRVRASLLRHYFALAEGGIEAIDEESGLPHVDHLACNVLFLKFRQLMMSTPPVSLGRITANDILNSRDEMDNAGITTTDCQCSYCMQYRKDHV